MIHIFLWPDFSVLPITWANFYASEPLCFQGDLKHFFPILPSYNEAVAWNHGQVANQICSNLVIYIVWGSSCCWNSIWVSLESYISTLVYNLYCDINHSSCWVFWVLIHVWLLQDMFPKNTRPVFSCQKISKSEMKNKALLGKYAMPFATWKPIRSDSWKVVLQKVEAYKKNMRCSTYRNGIWRMLASYWQHQFQARVPSSNTTLLIKVDQDSGCSPKPSKSKKPKRRLWKSANLSPWWRASQPIHATDLQ